MSADGALSIFESSWGSKGVETSLGLTHSSFEKPPVGTVRGLKIDSDCKAGEEVVSLRLTNCLVASSTQPSGRIKDCIDPEVWASMLPTTRLSIVLLNEFMEKSSTEFVEYMSILPEESEMNTPIHWSEADLQKLEQVYPHIVSKVEKQKQSYKSLYSLLTTRAVGGGRGAFIDDKEKVPLERLVWAMESVSSRAFSGVGGLEKDGFQLGAVFAAASVGLAISLASAPTVSIPGNVIDRETLTLTLGTLGALALVPSVVSSQTGSCKCVLLPVIDSCNHRSVGANCEMAYDVARECFVMKIRAGESVKAGQELTLSYGDRDNDDLLQYFGFVETDNPYDQYVFGGPGGRIRVTKGSREGWETPGVDDAALRGLLMDELGRLERLLLGEGSSVDGNIPSRLMMVFLAEKLGVIKEAIRRC